MKVSNAVRFHKNAIINSLQEHLLQVNEQFKQQRVARFEKESASSGYVRIN